MKRSDFHFELPSDLIAQNPCSNRGESRLLDCQFDFEDRRFSEIKQLLQPNDCLVINNTKVLKARLFGTKPTGGQVEVMVERIQSETAVTAMIRSNKALKPGSLVHLEGNTVVEVKTKNDMMYTLELQRSDYSLPELLNQFGTLPLPPYITHTPTQTDEQRYQTVYAKQPGAVAAPTAGLHFTNELLHAIKERGTTLSEITLHVGAGTFLPVKEDNIKDHQMHSERYEISKQCFTQLLNCKKQGGRIISVGTTSLRALEAWAKESNCNLNQHKAESFCETGFQGDTDIFISPGFEFKVVDCLITNFHLPESTLLMLVSAFAGKERIDQAYQHAIEKQYRFFSYGDAMWLTRPTHRT